jgi:DNA processing protein
VSSARPWTIEPGGDGYPPCLDDLDEPERPTIHGVGRREAVTGLDHHATVTIVGARRASGYGLRFAERLARDLALAGVSVVSGMALGIDAAAHRGALAGGGTTIAVLANGPDTAYPAAHRGLYERIVDTGAAIAEHPPGTRAQRHYFAVRNRIMAALGTVVVIVEAAQPSGSLITADVAARLGRSVGAVPGQVGVRVAEGANQLLKEGAHVIRGAEDVLDLLYGVGASARPPGERLAIEPELQAVLELVEGGAGTVDRVALAAGISPRDAAVALARLEQLGLLAAGAMGFARAHRT